MTASTPVAGDSKRSDRDLERREFIAGAWLLGHGRSQAYHSCPAPAVSHQPTRVVLNNLPRGARIVVGSLDVSGARHVVALAKSANVGETSEPVVAMRFTPRKADRDKQCVGPAEMQPVAAVDSSDPLLLRDAEANVLSSVSVDPPQINAQHLRAFMLPHFRDAGVIQEPAACELFNESSRGRVYLDPRVKNSQHAAQIRSKCNWLISAAESVALPIAETWIGKISDVDHDQKLTFVITNLDERTNQSSDVAPVHGCIRNVDFQSYSVLGGDIVYLDAAILNLPYQEQASLLTHELAHAAVCSIPHKRPLRSLNNPQATGTRTLFREGGRDIDADITEAAVPRITTSRVTDQIPSWLNEAVAHLLELQCIHTADSLAVSSSNFQRRIDNFFAHPASSPIVAAEHVMSPEERRSGSRGAATLFLKPWLTSPESMQEFLNSEGSLDQRMEVLTNKSFSEIFRDWALTLAAESFENQPLRVDDVPTGVNPEKFTLLGTAFRCFECSEDISAIVIESDVDAKLQISIIEPDTRVTSMQPVAQRCEVFPNDRNGK